jgi:hypothetical protein
MAETVYILCAVLSLTSATLLFRGYRTARSKLLLWSSLAFAFLALNNVILFADMIVFPTVDFGGALLRSLCGAIAGALLLCGLIWEMT